MCASRPSQRRLFSCLVLIGFAVGIALVAGSAARADDPDALRARAGELSAANEALALREQAALLQLYAIESRLARLQSRVAALHARVTELEGAERAAKEKLELAQLSEAQAEEQLALRIRTLYVRGEVDPITAILGASSLADALDVIESLRRLAAQDSRIVAHVRKTQTSLREALRAFAARETALRTLTRTAESARASLIRTHDKKAAYIGSLTRERDLNGADIQTLEALAARAERKANEIGDSLGEPADQGTATGEPVPADGAEQVAAADSEQASTTEDSSGLGRNVTVSMTMYCLRGYTATGIPVGPGVVATDPSVIPLGTRMYIPGYGDGVAADTGSAVVGLTIDAWVASCERADEWGRRNITITIYD